MTDLEIVPPDRPKCTRLFVETLIKDAGFEDKLAIVGRRGYFHDIGADKAGNDFGLYDDALFLISPVEFIAFNANTDPSRGEAGQAVLLPDRYIYAAGTHNRSKPIERQYRALVQISGVNILRVGAAQPEKRVFIGLNIHKGGVHTTGSEGCQTIYPDQWDEFMEAYDRLTAAAGVKKIPYILTEYRAKAAA